MQDKKDGELGVGIYLFLSLAIGLATVSLTTIAHLTILDSKIDLAEEIFPLITQIVIVSIPFLVLALMGTRSRLPWLSGLLVTAIFWGYYLYSGIEGSSAGTGANFGVIFLMMASPIIITGICVALALAQKSLAKRL